MELEDCCKVDIRVNSPLSSSSFGNWYGTVRLGHYTWRVDYYIFLLFSYSIQFILICSCEILGRIVQCSSMFILLLRKNSAQLKKKTWPFYKEEWAWISKILHSSSFGSRFGTVRLGNKYEWVCTSMAAGGSTRKGSNWLWFCHI